jgi:hypothetical protein
MTDRLQLLIDTRRVSSSLPATARTKYQKGLTTALSAVYESLTLDDALGVMNDANDDFFDFIASPTSLNKLLRKWDPKIDPKQLTEPQKRQHLSKLSNGRVAPHNPRSLNLSQFLQMSSREASARLAPLLSLSKLPDLKAIKKKWDPHSPAMSERRALVTHLLQLASKEVLVTPKPRRGKR